MPHLPPTDANLPLKIGITGGIGAGKSTVCRIFMALGFPVYDADSRARILLESDAELAGQIKSHFGLEAYLPEGALNRSWLAEQVFDKPDQLAILNSLVHPRVGMDFDNWYVAQQSPYVLKEAALLFESGSYKSLDAIIAVSAPENLRLQRTLMRDIHRSRAQVEEIMQRQMPEQERLQKANFRITNDEKSLVTPQVLRLHRKFLRREL